MLECLLLMNFLIISSFKTGRIFHRGIQVGQDRIKIIPVLFQGLTQGSTNKQGLINRGILEITNKDHFTKLLVHLATLMQDPPLKQVLDLFNNPDLSKTLYRDLTKITFLDLFKILLQGLLKIPDLFKTLFRDLFKTLLTDMNQTTPQPTTGHPINRSKRYKWGLVLERNETSQSQSFQK